MRACPACLSVFVGEPEYCLFDGHALADESALFGRVLGSYRLESLIGVGAMGCVFRGEHTATGERCAIKLAYGKIDGVEARFQREIDTISALNHPNIVRIKDSGRSPAGLTYMVMELLVGPTLRTIIEIEAPLAACRVRRFAQQLIAGLAEAHCRGFVHRDLKPGNIVVTRDAAGQEQLKILDFGIVSSLYGRTTDERLTKTGFIVGTPTYMAPEQIDAKSVTPEADIYALGVILYELLTGAPPFDGSIEQILVKKLTVAPAPVPQGGDFGALILAMLDARPERRPANALIISASLSESEGISGGPTTADRSLVDDRARPADRSLVDDRALIRPEDSMAPGLFDHTAIDPVARGASEGEWHDGSAQASESSESTEVSPEVDEPSMLVRVVKGERLVSPVGLVGPVEPVDSIRPGYSVGLVDAVAPIDSVGSLLDASDTDTTVRGGPGNFFADEAEDRTRKQDSVALPPFPSVSVVHPLPPKAVKAEHLSLANEPTKVSGTENFDPAGEAASPRYTASATDFALRARQGWAPRTAGIRSSRTRLIRARDDSWDDLETRMILETPTPAPTPSPPRLRYCSLRLAPTTTFLLTASVTTIFVFLVLVLTVYVW